MHYVLQWRVNMGFFVVLLLGGCFDSGNETSANSKTSSSSSEGQYKNSRTSSSSTEETNKNSTTSSASSTGQWKFLTEKGCVSSESLVGRKITPAEMIALGCKKEQHNEHRVILDCREVQDMQKLFIMTTEDC